MYCLLSCWVTFIKNHTHCHKCPNIWPISIKLSKSCLICFWQSLLHFKVKRSKVKVKISTLTLKKTKILLMTLTFDFLTLKCGRQCHRIAEYAFVMYLYHFTKIYQTRSNRKCVITKFAILEKIDPEWSRMIYFTLKWSHNNK